MYEIKASGAGSIKESDIELDFIKKLKELEYTYREDSCLFDGSGKIVEIKEDELYFSEYPFLRDLIWWRA
ncbi:MAG: hypothetical protein LGB71_03085 [Sulfurovum sp.]|nr:hypothetical protein [Sulfurovum sp.]MCB4759144.1 hypothetical protein [Sulfurovum sp.]MCB4763118.1 hypothetical protein [Sulfurovum sp.]MCB4765169.1 hypothetical protein [Sulfurovum sp.]MCB4766208.1 hypothetical protein [Sulfurovum sp.]